MTYPGRTRVGWGRFATLAAFLVIALLGAAPAGADQPVFSNVPSSVTLEATSSGGASHTYANPDATDGAGNPLSAVDCAPASGSMFPLGSTSVTCSVTDTVTGDPATASFTVTVQDTQGPLLMLPGNITQSATSAAGAVVDFTASAADVVAGSVPVMCTPASGTAFALGSTTVNCSATDGTNSTAGTFVVTVNDTTAPTVSVSGPSSVTTTDPAGIAVTYTATASDNVDGALTPSCDRASGSVFPVGTTTVSCSSTDAAGNTGSGTLSVTVTLIDNTAPVVVAPDALNLTTTVLGGAIGTFAATASDNVDGALTPSCNPASGSLFAIGSPSATVTCTATDARGNVGSKSFPVNVALVDTTAPTVTVPGNIIAEAKSQAGAAVTFSASASDNIDGVVSATCSPASGATFGFGATTVTCSATDTRSNKGSASFTVTVRDTTPPVVTPGSDRVVEANGRSGSNVSYDVSATDAIDGPMLPSAIVCAPGPGALFGLGTSSVVCNATDSRGNVGTGRLTVTVVDTTPPTLSVPAPLRVSATGGLSAAVPAIAGFLGAARAADIADSSPRVSSDAPAFFPLGTTTVTFAAVDSSGNRVTRTSTVTVTTETVSPSAQPDVVPPANVSNLRAQALNRSIRLRWRPPADRDFARVEVVRSTTTVGAESVTVYRGRATTFLDRRLANGTEYRYLFVSVDAAGNRSFGVVVVAAPKRQLLTVPALGARVRVPPLLAWVRVSGASYYNVQVSRNGRKILSAWPTRNRLKLAKTWAFAGRRQRLAPGTYRWYVWPGFGAQRESRYGQLLGEGSFVVVR